MAASLPNSQHMQHRHHLPAHAMKDENTSMRNPYPAHHHRHNDNLLVEVGTDVHDRTHARTLALIQKAEATLRTYSRSSPPSHPNVERRRARKRRQRRPPKISTFHFEQRRRREKQSAGYEADIEFDLEEDDTTSITNDTTLNVGIFPSAASHRRKMKRYFCAHDESRIDSSGTSLLADHSVQPTKYECQQHLTPAKFSPNLYQNTIDNVSVGTAATMASTISASSTALPFRVGTDPSSPFTISQTNLTMSQAIALSHHAHIIVDAKSPFIVKHVNAAFCRILNSYGISSDVLGEPLLKSSQGQHEAYPIAAQQGNLQQIILEAKKIILFPIVSEHGGSSQGWEFHATDIRHDFGRGTGTSTGAAGGIINHFLIQVVDENFQNNFMRAIA